MTCFFHRESFLELWSLPNLLLVFVDPCPFPSFLLHVRALFSPCLIYCRYGFSTIAAAPAAIGVRPESVM